jgi:hypothetical protein
MSSIQKFPISEFPTLNCTKLVVNPITTVLKWNPANKHPGVVVLGAIDTAKTISPEGESGIIAKTGSVIGTDAKTWYYEIKETVLMHVGMAPITQDFTTVVGTAVDQLINVTEGDKVRFTLTTASTLSVRHEKGDGSVLGITVHDMTAVTGQTMYPWVSDISSDTMSVKIMEDFKFEIYVDPNGAVHMNGLTNDIVDFSLDDIISNNPGSGGSGTGTSISNGGSSVTVENSGDINLNGGISFKCDNITAPLPSVNLGVDQYAVIISNPVSTAVLLPSASANPCQYYSVIRNYPLQLGETWHNPVLRVVATGSDTVENMVWFGIPPDSNIQVMSDGISMWRIM